MMSFKVKEVHLETDLTTAAFIATLCHFTAQHGKPSTIWSDHGTNFVGAAREVKELYTFLKKPDTQWVVSGYCTMQDIHTEFTLEQVPHFGNYGRQHLRA